MDFKNKSDKTFRCKMSCISVSLCEFPAKELVLTVVYGFGEEPMLLISSLKMQEKKKLYHIITKVYLLRWRPEEYFRFKKQHFKLENLRVMTLQSIRNLNLLATLAVDYIGLITAVHKDSIFLAEIKECFKRIYKIPYFILCAVGDALERILSMCRSGISSFLPQKVKSQQITLFKYFKIADCGT